MCHSGPNDMSYLRNVVSVSEYDKNPTNSIGQVQSKHLHHHRHDIAEQLLTWS